MKGFWNERRESIVNLEAKLGAHRIDADNRKRNHKEEWALKEKAQSFFGTNVRRIEAQIRGEDAVFRKMIGKEVKGNMRLLSGEIRNMARQFAEWWERTK